jgi:hypothetical protein
MMTRTDTEDVFYDEEFQLSDGKVTVPFRCWARMVDRIEELKEELAKCNDWGNQWRKDALDKGTRIEELKKCIKELEKDVRKEWLIGYDEAYSEMDPHNE